jgi:hypothetical protein
VSCLKSINERKTTSEVDSMEELSEQQRAEIRLIAEMTFEATLKVDAKLSKLLEKRRGESSAIA